MLAALSFNPTSVHKGALDPSVEPAELLGSGSSLCSKLSMKEIKTCRYETLVPKLCCVLWSRNSDFENPNPS